MSLKVCVVVVLLIGVMYISLSHEKPTAVLNRCMCRGGAAQINVRNIKGLQLIPIPNCPLQLIATLKNGRRICLHSKFLSLWRNKGKGQRRM
ncbi:stromal cell-derived factor 1-like [Leucoraja erinacea]|uniref:stromal cell-derived factor 1-like n=1 Tax=Leucoraja erinaceus TaxID=7782 RepID=UPI0024588991|nr:stromal cell-derived factor 1-like [Leucoraja erinacea]